MRVTDSKDRTTSSSRIRLWAAIAVGFVVITVIAIASGAVGDFTRGFRDGFNAEKHPDTSRSR